MGEVGEGGGDCFDRWAGRRVGVEHVGQKGAERSADRLARLRRAALEAEVQRRGQRPQVGRRAHARRPERGGDAEPRQHGPSRGREDDGGRLDVAVDDPHPVRRAQRREQVHRDAGDLHRGKGMAFEDGLLEGGTLGKVDDQPGTAVLDDHLVDGLDRGVAESGDQADLAPDRAAQVSAGCGVRRESYLSDPDVAAHEVVGGEPERPGAQGVQQPIASGQPALAVHGDFSVQPRAARQHDSGL
ncbi:hypothetical protein GCM10010404_39830 [Nonomuraea africana]|uniref:Uncharacterized protein n=1 Tax=Nonomuraea africana TaxID=46171 RepID=A0ABR9KV10_9ACTN|nr:hypothetical protein [Nonomuraea africana]MBE1565879.1 hypothetical protein [Nonomuraea africana]